MIKKLTIITPTYNRANKIRMAFASLQEQSMQEFEWLIIDDGSQDNTSEIVNKLKKEAKFPIHYIKQKNQGKHIALNQAFKIVSTELLMILDSDDTLINTAVRDILEVHNKYKENKDVMGYVYQKGNFFNKDQKMTPEFASEEFLANYNKYIINKGIKGDKAEVFKTSIICQYEFPKFEDEKFLGEGVLWSKMSHHYNMIFCNKVIYLCEYLEDGLTKSGRELRIRNPKGGRYHAKEYLSKRYSIKVRIKNALLYLIYSKILGESYFETIKKARYKVLLVVIKIPSEMLYWYWNKKYIRRK